MKYAHLELIQTPKEDLKITPIYRNSRLLETIGAQAGRRPSLPDVAEFYTTPVVFPAAGTDRPYLISSIVLSADGKMAFMDNQMGPLIAKCNGLDPTGGAADFWCLNMLRANSDGLLIGANTLRNEPIYINNCMERDLLEQRATVLGKPDQPCQVVVSLDATDIPFEHSTFWVDPAERMKVAVATSPAGLRHIREHSPLRHVTVGPFTNRDEVDAAKFPALDAEFDVVPVIVTGSGDRPDMGLMLYVLRRMGMEVVSVESPGYCGALLANGYLDEYFINYSMVYVGGTMSPSAAFPTSWKEHPHAELVSVGIHRQNFLFTRQKLRYGVSAE